jgi:hypothetical protein
MARPCLNNCVKFKRLVQRLGLARPYVRGLLETLWDVANEVGNPVIGTADDVETAAEWPGVPGALFDLLREGHWLDKAPGGRWQIHDFWDHCPEYVLKRARREDGRKQRYAPRRRAMTAPWRRVRARGERPPDAPRPVDSDSTSRDILSEGQGPDGSENGVRRPNRSVLCVVPRRRGPDGRSLPWAAGHDA